MAGEVISSATEAGFTVVRARIPEFCWSGLREAIDKSSPEDPEDDDD